MDMQLPFTPDETGEVVAARRGSPARLIEYTHGRHVALPVHTTLELMALPALIEVPGAAYYARGLLKWQGRHLPVVDLYTLLRAYPNDLPQRLRYALIVAYQTAPREPVRHGALALPALPQTVEVTDDDQCDLPDDSDLWPLLALSCFRYDGRAVPILDGGRLFGSSHA